MALAGQGKFDVLTKELVTHILGFQEGCENFVRSEQYVLSNLLYHHCLGVNSHAVRRSIDGLALKFTVHGQHRRAQRLNDLTTQFLAIPEFKDHYEADIEWSLLSLLLHLSNSPTQVPLSSDSGASPLPGPLLSLTKSQQGRREGAGEEGAGGKEEEDWVAYLKDEEEEYCLGPEEDLSDWSSDDESSDQEISQSLSQPHQTLLQPQQSLVQQATQHSNPVPQPNPFTQSANLPRQAPSPFTQSVNLPMPPSNPFSLDLESQNRILDQQRKSTNSTTNSTTNSALTSPSLPRHSINTSISSEVLHEQGARKQDQLPHKPPRYPREFEQHSQKVTKQLRELEEQELESSKPPRRPAEPKLEPYKPPPPAPPNAVAARESLEQLHRARSWLSAKTQLQYWGPKCPSQQPLSEHPSANVLKLWETDQGLRNGAYQQVWEWSVMREVVWSLSCPTPSHFFTTDQHGTFSVNPRLSLPSLTPGATKKLLGRLCPPLTQLCTLDKFIQYYQSASSTTTTTSPPVTLMAYATGLACWRRKFRAHLRFLEERIREQESTCTLLWLEEELNPWLRTLATLHSVHCTALHAPHNATPDYVAARLLGTLCEGVDGCGDGVVRVVMVRLLLHSMRHYLSIIHTWLTHASLLDLTNEFIIKRDESVEVEDERFWREAFTISLLNHKNLEAKDPVRTLVKFLSPLLASLTSIGKSQELLSFLEESSHIPGSLGIMQEDFTQEIEISLEETVIQYVSEALCKYAKDQSVNNDIAQESKADNKGEKNEGPMQNGEEKEKKGGQEATKRGDELDLTTYRDQADPFLWAAFTETEQHNSQTLPGESHMDDVTRQIEDICEAPRAVSSVSLLSGALSPLVAKTQDRVSARLTRSLLDHHALEQHFRAVRGVLLMEAGDIMHEFYTHLFYKVDGGESVDGLSLSLHLQYCVARLYPQLAQYFSVNIKQDCKAPLQDPDIPDPEDEPAEPLLIEEVHGSGKEALRRLHQKARHPSEVTQDSSMAPLSRTELPKLCIQYQAPWPANLLLTEATMTRLNLLFNFLLNLKRVTNGLERLKFRELSSWQLTMKGMSDSDDEDQNTESSPSGLPWRLHRLQLLRHWVLCFSRELHNHFANAVFLPYHMTVDQLFHSRPSLNTILTEHDKMLKRLLTDCLMGSNEKVIPLQIVLDKVFQLTRRLSELWVCGAGGSGVGGEVTRLENHYVCLHRYLAHFLTTFINTTFVPHMEGLTRVLVDTVPVLTKN